MENQRKHFRIPIGQADNKTNGDGQKRFKIPIATVELVTASGLQHLTMVFVKDISKSGMGAYVSRQFEKDATLLVKIKLTKRDRGVIAETLEGRVCWMKEVEGEVAKYVFGLEFLGMKQKHPKLYNYLEELETLSADALFFLKKPA